MLMFIVFLLFAAPLACGVYSLWSRRPDAAAKSSSSLALEPERAPTPLVARALTEGLSFFAFRGTRLRSFDLEVECKNGSSGTIAEALAQKIQSLDPALLVKRSEAVTMKETAKPEKDASGRAVIHNGKVLSSVSSIHVSNHSLISLRAAKTVPAVLKEFPGTVRCKMTLYF